jgi:hypothetical protein
MRNTGLIVLNREFRVMDTSLINTAITDRSMAGVGMSAKKEDGVGVRKRDAGGIIAMNIEAACISGCKWPFCNVCRRALSDGNKQKEGTVK